MGDAPPGRGQPLETGGNTGYDRRDWKPGGESGRKAAPGERPASHQLVGWVTASRGYDGYPA